MEFYDLVKSRRSVRAFKNEPVSRDKIDRMLDAGRLAPSWCNRQCWRYIVITDAQMKKNLGELIENPSAECYESAPYVLVLCADPTDSGYSSGKDYYLVDCGISMEHVVLAAEEEGLGACWVGSFRENAVRNLLGIPQDVRVIALCPVGVPDETPQLSQRKALCEIVMEGAWRN